MTVRQENGSEIVDFKYVSHETYDGKKKHRVRPILLNNWEAAYFDFTEEKYWIL